MGTGEAGVALPCGSLSTQVLPRSRPGRTEAALAAAAFKYRPTGSRARRVLGCPGDGQSALRSFSLGVEACSGQNEVSREGSLGACDEGFEGLKQRGPGGVCQVFEAVAQNLLWRAGL